MCFLLQCLTKTGSPYITVQTVVHTCCVLGHITDSWIVSRQPGAVVHDGRTEMQRLGASPCYHWLFGIIRTCSSWSLYLSGIFSKTQCLLVSTNQCSQFSLTYSEVGFPGLDPGSDPYRGISRAAEPWRPIISGLQHRISVTTISAVQGSTCTLLLREKNLPYRVNKES